MAFPISIPFLGHPKLLRYLCLRQPHGYTGRVKALSKWGARIFGGATSLHLKIFAKDAPMVSRND